MIGTTGEPSATPIRADLLEKMMFAKSLLVAGETACQDTGDKYDFSRGLMLLCDALEMALVSVASQVNVQLGKANPPLMTFYTAINAVGHGKGNIPSEPDMNALSKIRAAIKHHGIFPDPKSNSQYPTLVRALLEDLCRRFFSIELQDISLKTLITNPDIRRYIDQAEDAFAQGKIEDCMIALAYVAHFIYGRTRMPSSYDAKKRYVYEKDGSFTHLWLDLLACGVKTADYHRFKDLVPIIGKDTDTNTLFHEWQFFFDHQKNWTSENVRFCIDFCIDAALKFQNSAYKEQIYYSSAYFQKITPKVGMESVRIFSLPRLRNKDGKMLPEVVVKEIKQGEVLIGNVSPHDRNDQEMLVMSFDIPHEKKDKIGHGFIKKDEVDVEVFDEETKQSIGKLEIH